MNLLNCSTVVFSDSFSFNFYEKENTVFILLKTRVLKTLREPLAQSFSWCVIKALPLFLNVTSTANIWHAVQF